MNKIITIDVCYYTLLNRSLIDLQVSYIPVNIFSISVNIKLNRFQKAYTVNTSTYTVIQN